MVKQIRKRAAKFEKALSIVEKQFEGMADKPGALPQPFDLSTKIAEDVKNAADEKRKIRNKRKAVMRKRRNK